MLCIVGNCRDAVAKHQKIREIAQSPSEGCDFFSIKHLDDAGHLSV